MPPDTGEPGISSTEMKEVFSTILTEIIEDITLELCFKVHRALTLNYFAIDEYIVKDGQLMIHNPAAGDENQNYDFFAPAPNSKKTAKIICPHCKIKVGTFRFAPHLNKCMNEGGRQNKDRGAKRTMHIFESDEDDDDELYSDSGRRRKKKPTKNAKKVSKTRIKSRQTNVDLTQKCGVLSLKQKTMCQNTLKCGIHTDEQRREVRRTFLKSEPDPNVHIDVDTVDIVSRSPSPSDFSLDSNNSSVLSIKMEDACSTPEQPRLTPSYS